MTGTQKDVRAEMKKIHDMPPEVSDVVSILIIVSDKILHTYF